MAISFSGPRRCSVFKSPQGCDNLWPAGPQQTAPYQAARTRCARIAPCRQRRKLARRRAARTPCARIFLGPRGCSVFKSPQGCDNLWPAGPQQTAPCQAARTRCARIAPCRQRRKLARRRAARTPCAGLRLELRDEENAAAECGWAIAYRIRENTNALANTPAHRAVISSSLG
jgi:hypothetical protein